MNIVSLTFYNHYREPGRVINQVIFGLEVVWFVGVVRAGGEMGA
jgi:hypothetical protein